MSYYQKCFVRLVELLVKSGLVTRAEIESGKPAEGSPRAIPPLTADRVPKLQSSGALASRDVSEAPRFHVGQRVRARNIHPLGHTRLPRYARGKLGMVHLDHGVYVFPDTNAPFLGERPQHVYSVRFASRELLGEQAPPQGSRYVCMSD